MDQTLTEVLQWFDRFRAVMARNDFGSCTKILSQLKRSGVEFPHRTSDSALIFTPPVTHPTVGHAHANYGMPSNSSTRLDEAMSSEMETLSLSSISSMREVLDVLSSMMQAVNPNDRMMWLANDGNYRELRWFTTWKHKEQLEDFQLPTEISEALSQQSVPFGYRYVQFLDTAVASEVCEEFFTPMPSHTELALNGVEVFLNASGSHHQLRKLDLRLCAFIGATHTRGGVYKSPRM